MEVTSGELRAAGAKLARLDRYACIRPMEEHVAVFSDCAPALVTLLLIEADTMDMDGGPSNAMTNHILGLIAKKILE